MNPEPSPDSVPPPSSRFSNLPPPPPEPGLLEVWQSRLARFVEHMGDIGVLTWRALRAATKRPFEISSTIYQIESLGVRSLGIVAVTSVFIGMVMTIQFAFGLQRFGGVEYIPRVIILSFLRELGPTLTAIIVGGRIGSGMAAEVGAMNVTEQVDAIRALGGDPAKKLVL
ncbi:MAG TPA: ABC transporter permease, partial [Polyangiaceae bacterium]